MIDGLTGNLERYLNLLSARQKLVVSNIANADTPGYLSQDIDFTSEYLSQIEGPPRAVDAPGLAAKNDGNNVSMDRETRLLAENAIRFNAATSLVRSRFRMYRTAIQEGRNG